MKKVLVMAAVALMGLQAKAGNIILTEIDYDSVATHSQVGADPEKAQGEIGFRLDIADQFIYKLFNDAVAPAANDPGQPSVQPEALIDLGLITGGISTAADCSGLTGLAAASTLGVTAATDSDTGVAVVARSAECGLSIVGLERVLQMRIPLQEVALKSGAKQLMADYSIEQVAGAEFDRLALCDSAVDGQAVTATACDGGAVVGADHVVLDAATAQGQNGLTVELHAKLQGANSKSSYEGYVVAVVGLEI